MSEPIPFATGAAPRRAMNAEDITDQLNELQATARDKPEPAEVAVDSGGVLVPPDREDHEGQPRLHRRVQAPLQQRLMSDPDQTPTLGQAFEAAKHMLLAGREGLGDLPEIARAEVRASRTGGTRRTAGSADTETPEDSAPSGPARPDFAAFDKVIQARVDELTQKLRQAHGGNAPRPKDVHP